MDIRKLLQTYIFISGCSQVNIAKELGLGRSTICRYLANDIEVSSEIKNNIYKLIQSKIKELYSLIEQNN